VPFQHHIRDAVVRDKVRKGLYKVPRKDGWMDEKRQWKDLECNSGIRNRGAIRQLHLKKERTTTLTSEDKAEDISCD
jgi:hypothetical protein